MRTLLILAAALLLQDESTPSVLDRGQGALRRQMGGGQAIAAFWDGFDAGTMAEFRGAGECRGQKFESAGTYRIVRRDPTGLTLSVESNGTSREFQTPHLTPQEHEALNVFRPKPRVVDRELPAKEIVKVGGKEYTCRVFERTSKASPQCGTDEPRFRQCRSRVWWCPEVSAGGGILKVVSTYSEIWDEGSEVETQVEEMVVTDLDVKRRIGDTEVSGHAITHLMRRKTEVIFESVELRSSGVPGGIFDARMKVGARTDHFWIERLTAVKIR